MRILEIGPYPPPYGGWSRRVKLLKDGLTERGHECVVLNMSHNRWPPTAEYDGFRNRLHFLSKVWSYSGRGFALHVHINAKSLHQLAVALICRAMAWMWRNRMVLTMHGGPDQSLLLAESWGLRTLVRITLRLPDHVICNSEPVRVSIIRAGGIPRRVSAIPGFTWQYLNEIWAPTGTLAEFAQSHRPLLVCYACVLRNEPTLQVLLEAVRALRPEFPQMGVVLLGLSRVEESWSRLELDDAVSDHVLWQWNLPAPLFLGLLREADVFVRSSPTDGVASSILEALALGVPVVASRLEGRPAGVIEYDLLDGADLAEKVRLVVAQPKPSSDVLRQVVPDTLMAEVSLLETVFSDASVRAVRQ